MSSIIAAPRVFMYHAIVQPGCAIPPEREEGADLYDVPLASFQAQMHWLKDRGITVATYANNQPVPEASVVLTFDDGERNNFESAWPILKQNGFSGYFFVTVQRIGCKGYMDWEQLRELRDSGMVIGSHGMTHRVLTGLKDGELESELLESKMVLERELMLSIEDFSIPRGFCDSRVVTRSKAAGYRRIFVSDEFPKDTKCVGRVAVRRGWTVKRFAAAVEGKTPAKEQLLALVRESTKSILGQVRYDAVRKRMLQVMK